MFLTIKKIPKVSWSSDETFNLKPKLSTLFFLCFGLTLFGLGEGLLIVSFTGASPWSVLAQGISLNVNLTIGTITLLISIGVLIMWIPLSQKFFIYSKLFSVPSFLKVRLKWIYADIYIFKPCI